MVPYSAGVYLAFKGSILILGNGHIILTAVSYVQVILLENCIMLLQKQDEKYLLKFHTSAAAPLGGGGGGGGGGKHWHSPVIKFATLLIRPVATGN